MQILMKNDPASWKYILFTLKVVKISKADIPEGLILEDVIKEIDGIPVKNSNDVMKVFSSFISKPGKDKVKLTIDRFVEKKNKKKSFSTIEEVSESDLSSIKSKFTSSRSSRTKPKKTKRIKKSQIDMQIISDYFGKKKKKITTKKKSKKKSKK